MLKKLLFCGLTFIEVKEDNNVSSSGPLLEYSGRVWAFVPLSGLLLLHPNGSICSIHDLHALSMFGYSKDELLQKVGQNNPQNKLAVIIIRSTLTFFIATLLTECYFSDARLL